MDQLPAECVCSNAGTCRVCLAVAWALQNELVDPASAAPTRPKVRKKKDLSKTPDRTGPILCVGARQSPSAKRKARLTRLREERERVAAALAARRLDKCLAQEAIQEAQTRISAPPSRPMPKDLIARLARYLAAHPDVRCTVYLATRTPVPPAPGYVTASAPRMRGVPVDDPIKETTPEQRANALSWWKETQAERNSDDATTEDDYRNKTPRGR